MFGALRRHVSARPQPTLASKTVWVTDRVYVRRVRFLINAGTVQDIYSHPGLRLHALSGNRSGQHSLRLPGGVRLIIELLTETNTVRIIEVVAYHD